MPSGGRPPRFRRRAHRTSEKEKLTTGPPPPRASSADPCAKQSKAFKDCVKNTSGSDNSKCQVYLDMLIQCRKSKSKTPIAVKQP